MAAFSRNLVCVLLSLTVCGVASKNARAEMPRAQFTVEGKWMKCHVSRDGRPVAGVTLEILDAVGRPFASGEAEDDGACEFPLPPGDELTLLLRVDGKTADAIRLTREAAGVFPGEVLLSFGLAPCCRVPSKRDFTDESSGSSPDNGKDEMFVNIALAIGVLLVGAIAMVLSNSKTFQSPGPTSLPTREQ